jgi:hypothetical protein
MLPRFSTLHVVYLLLLVVSLGATSYLAYQIGGFLGIGVLGLIIGVIALAVELERGDLLATIKLQACIASIWPLWKECPRPREPKGVLRSRAQYCRCLWQRS